MYSGPTLQTAELYFSSPFPSFQSFLFSTNDDPLHYTENGCLGKLDEWEGPVRSCSRRGWIAACSAVPIVFWALKRCTNRYRKRLFRRLAVQLIRCFDTRIPSMHQQSVTKSHMGAHGWSLVRMHRMIREEKSLRLPRTSPNPRRSPLDLIASLSRCGCDDLSVCCSRHMVSSVEEACIHLNRLERHLVNPGSLMLIISDSCL